MSTLSGFWHAAARMAGRIDFSQVLQRMECGESLARASSCRLIEAGLEPAKLQVLRSTPSIECDELWLTMDDPAYPERLKQLPFAPAILFYRGRLDRLEHPAIAIVGARHCTVSGRAVATTMSRAAMQLGQVVVSGLARGIDESAHRASPGWTIAVLGQGLGSSMAWGRRSLADQIVERGGLLLSEFLPHLPASRWTFPQRNRVIAGLASATLVIEATQKSGSLITARHALDYGREVLAVPGHPSHPLAQGGLQLIRDGAQMVASREDLRDALGLDPLAVEGDLLSIDLLDIGCTIEDLMESTDLSATELHARISRGILMGQLHKLPGDRFIRIR
jgi:DNA processing protein